MISPNEYASALRGRGMGYRRSGMGDWIATGGGTATDTDTGVTGQIEPAVAANYQPSQTVDPVDMTTDALLAASAAAAAASGNAPALAQATGTTVAQAQQAIASGGGTVASGGSAGGGGGNVAQTIASLTGALTPLATLGIQTGLTIAGKTQPRPAVAAITQPLSTTAKVVIGVVVVGTVGAVIYFAFFRKAGRRRRRNHY